MICMTFYIHDDVIKWKHFPRNWPFVRGINSPVREFPAKGRSFDVFFDMCLNQRLSKQWWGWWFETLPRPSWRHCNDVKLCNAVTDKLGQYYGCWWPSFCIGGSHQRLWNWLPKIDRFLSSMRKNLIYLRHLKIVKKGLNIFLWHLKWLQHHKG